jgi:hypothetical protein
MSAKLYLPERVLTGICLNIRSYRKLASYLLVQSCVNVQRVRRTAMKMKQTVFIPLLLIFMASGSGLVSVASSSVPATSTRFEQLDANKVGQVGAEEAGNDIE